MKNSIEYQIFIGCNDPQLNDELIKDHELKEMVARFFARKHIDFSILSAKGGYLYESGWYELENSLCISIIGTQNLDILKLARSLSMYMNQKCSLIIKTPLQAKLV